jgi:Amt family ammonium transporter
VGHRKRWLAALALACVVGTLALSGGAAWASSTDGGGTTTDALTHTDISLNLLWVVIGAVLVVFMQAGFALVETGFCRAKHAAHVVSTNFAIFGIGFVAYYCVGYAFMFGGSSWPTIGYNNPLGGSLIGSGNHTLLWHGGFFLHGSAYDVSVMAFFLYMVAFMDTTATIPTGAMAERWKWNSFVIWGLFCGAIYYPLFGAWTWGGGWLAKLGASADLGHGYTDFAGSGVVHMMGGAAALAGALVLGPRIGKYGPDGKPRTLAAHHIPMAMLGTFILLFGWFGFNAASTLGATDHRFAVIATNTAIAGAFGAVFGMLWVQFRSPDHKPDPGMMANGMLAGLVAITAPCAFVKPWAAAIIGIIAGCIVVEAVWFIEKKGIDDPVGAISVHGINGAWGLLAVGLFADGSYGGDWNGTNATGGSATDNIWGLFYGHGGGGQLVAQIIGILTIAIVMGGIALAFFKIQNALTKGGIRPTEDVELQGVDIPEMGVLAYPEFFGSSPHVEAGTPGDGHRPMPDPVPVGQEHSR